MHETRFTKRYHLVTKEKAGGATYTPKILADFVADQIVSAAGAIPTDRPLRVLDPAIGHGELLVSLLGHLADRGPPSIELYGFETDPRALAAATERLTRQFPDAKLHFVQGNFIEFVLEQLESGESLFHRSVIPTHAPGYDVARKASDPTTNGKLGLTSIPPFFC
jgi:hypothetical protein